jgi:hypothetical protein
LGFRYLYLQTPCSRPEGSELEDDEEKDNSKDGDDGDKDAEEEEDDDSDGRSDLVWRK